MTKQAEREPMFRSIDELEAWERNYNKGDVAAIARSIQAFGYNGRLAVHGKTVMAGNHALQALRRLKEAGDPFPGGEGLRIEPDGSWAVLVTPLNHLSREQAEAFAVADNRTAALAEHDEERLAVLLKEIRDRDEDELLATGYDLHDLEQVLRKIGELSGGGKADPNRDLGAVEELWKKWGTRRGQLWEIPSKECPGKSHRLICGDATDAATVRRLMAGERAVLFATDPPYLVEYDGTNHPQDYNTDRSTRNKDWGEIYEDREWDSQDFDALYDGFIGVAVAEAITPNAAWYCWHASKNQAMVEAAWERHGAFVHQQIIWTKTQPVLTRCWYMWAHEPCFMGWIRGNKPPRRSEQHPTTVWHMSRVDGTTDNHPTSKPTGLWEMPIMEHTVRGDVCFEPFSGSGTHLIAAENLGRLCYAVELQPGFVAVALERLHEMGLEPRLLEDAPEAAAAPASAAAAP